MQTRLDNGDVFWSEFFAQTTPYILLHAVIRDENKVDFKNTATVTKRRESAMLLF